MKKYLYALICTMLWGSAIPAIKIGYSLFKIAPDATADKLVFAGIRFVGAGIIILVPLCLISQKIKIKKELVTHSLVIGFIQTAAQYFFMYIGLTYTTSVNASIYNAGGTLLYIILARIIFRDEKLSKLKLLGCAIGFFGILMNSLATQQIGLVSLQGDGFIILSNICVAVGFLYSKHSVKSANPYLLTGMQMAIGGSILLTLGLLLGGKLPVITMKGLILLFYLMVVSSVAFSLWTLLLRDYPSAFVGMFNFLTPLFGAIFSYVLSKFQFINEDSSFTIYTVFATLCSVGGIFLSSLGNIKQKKEHTPH